MTLPVVEVYFHAGDERSGFKSERTDLAEALERAGAHPGWNLYPAHDLAALLRSNGEKLVAGTLEDMEEPHVVRVFLLA